VASAHEALPAPLGPSERSAMAAVFKVSLIRGLCTRADFSRFWKCHTPARLSFASDNVFYRT